MPHSNTLGPSLRARRESLGLTQVQLAERLSVSQRAISNWEAGIRQPWSLAQWQALAEALGCSVVITRHGARLVDSGAITLPPEG